MGARLCTFRGVWIVDSVGVRGSAVAFEQVVRGGVPPRGRLVNVDGCGQRVAQGAGTGQSGAAVCGVLHIVGRVVARSHSCRGRFPTDPPPVPRRVRAVPPACPQLIPVPRPRGGAPPAPPRTSSRATPGPLLGRIGELRDVGAVVPHRRHLERLSRALPRADPQSHDHALPSPTDTSSRSSGPCGRAAP